jgi:hypothetical protein
VTSATVSGAAAYLELVRAAEGDLVGAGRIASVSYRETDDAPAVEVVLAPTD